ncbi:MAG: hypoxanthine phosphoribosyltransferase [Phycisphaerae bacterium]
MDSDISRILIHRDQISARVRAMAGEISACYHGPQTRLTLAPILSGSLIFLADLIRELPLKMKLSLLHVSTYAGATTTPGQPRVIVAPTGEIAGRDVLVIDDILDTGRTLARVQTMIRDMHPASVRTAVLLRKPGKASGVEADFVGFDIDDEFVVGYGLDYGDLYRNYPHIALLRPELIR